jgi:predicted anti-sigma-YlaC factor YlaD
VRPTTQSMRCEQWREALSARLDGEGRPDERAAVDEHLAGCADCRAWWDAAATVNRLARTAAARPVAAVPEAVLEAAPGPGRARIAGALRGLLGALGAIQFSLGMLQVGGSTAATAVLHAGHVDAAGHLWHESAAWNIAVGAGFAWIATRRTRTTGLLPLLTAFVAALILLSGSDVLAGRVETERLLSHAFVITGYAILVLLGRAPFTFAEPPRSSRGRWRAHFDADATTVAPPALDRRAPETAHYHDAA